MAKDFLANEKLQEKLLGLYASGEQAVLNQVSIRAVPPQSTPSPEEVEEILERLLKVAEVLGGLEVCGR